MGRAATPDNIASVTEVEPGKLAAIRALFEQHVYGSPNPFSDSVMLWLVEELLIKGDPSGQFEGVFYGEGAGDITQLVGNFVKASDDADPGVELIYSYHQEHGGNLFSIDTSFQEPQFFVDEARRVLGIAGSIRRILELPDLPGNVREALLKAIMDDHLNGTTQHRGNLYMDGDYSHLFSVGVNCINDPQDEGGPRRVSVDAIYISPTDSRTLYFDLPY